MKAEQLEGGVGLAVAVSVDINRRVVLALELLVANLAVAVVAEAVLADEVELRPGELGEVDLVEIVEVGDDVGLADALLEMLSDLKKNVSLKSPRAAISGSATFPVVPVPDSGSSP